MAREFERCSEYTDNPSGIQSIFDSIIMFDPIEPALGCCAGISGAGDSHEGCDGTQINSITYKMCVYATYLAARRRIPYMPAQPFKVASGRSHNGPRQIVLPHRVHDA